MDARCTYSTERRGLKQSTGCIFKNILRSARDTSPLRRSDRLQVRPGIAGFPGRFAGATACGSSLRGRASRSASAA